MLHRRDDHQLEAELAERLQRLLSELRAGLRERFVEQNATTIQPYIDSVVMVSKTEPTGRNARPVASVATRTISEFTTLRHEMRATTRRMPAGVCGCQVIAGTSPSGGTSAQLEAAGSPALDTAPPIASHVTGKPPNVVRSKHKRYTVRGKCPVPGRRRYIPR